MFSRDALGSVASPVWPGQARSAGFGGRSAWMVSGAVVEKWMDMNIYLILLMCQLETSQINMNTDLMTVGQPEQVFFEDNV